MSTNLWIWLGLGATVLWGGTYALLKPAGAVSPFVTNVIVGALGFVTGLLGLAVESRSDPSRFNAAWLDLGIDNRWIYILGYSVANVVAAYLYLYATQLPGVQISVLTAMTSCYPLVTTLLCFLFFAEWKRVRLALAVPGLALATASCILLAMSPLPADAAQQNQPAAPHNDHLSLSPPEPTALLHLPV